MSGVFTLLPEATFLHGGVRPFYGVGPVKRSGAAVQRASGLDMVTLPTRAATPLPLGVRACNSCGGKKRTEVYGGGMT